MYHLFRYRRKELLAHYHRRSNVETVFAMMKAKFGEVLGKVVAHNLCCPIQAFYELGIDPAFDGLADPARKILSPAS